MSKVRRRRRSCMHRLRGVLAGVAMGGLALGVLPANPAAAAGPTGTGPSSCTPQAPYAVDALLTGFPPNETIKVIIVFYLHSGSTFDLTWEMSTDSKGEGFLPDFNDTGPYRVGTLFFRDRNNDGKYDKNDDFIVNLLFTVDQPCTDAVVQPK